MNKDTNKEYFETVKGVIGGMIILVLIVMFFSCCKSASHLQKSTNDSTNVKKSNVVESKTDSSGSKSDKTNTKETFYYPQPIYIQGKDGEVKVVSIPQYIKESGTEKTEQAQITKDESWREAFDSLRVSITEIAKDKKVRVGPSLIEWILIATVGFLVLSSLLGKFKIIKK